MLDKLDEINRKVETYCEENQFSGMLRVTVRDKILYDAFYGRDGSERTHTGLDKGYI